MIVVVHEAAGVADPVISLVDVLEGVQEVYPVLVALEDGLSFVAPGGDVVDCTGVFYAERAGHIAIVCRFRFPGLFHPTKNE
jgi:hypothetical protein